MGEFMKHLSEEQMIEHYYGEGGHRAGVEQHLRACSVCGDAYAALERDISAIGTVTPPMRDAQYGERVWQSIRGTLPVYVKQRRSWLSVGLWKGFAYATACLLLVSTAFFAGRHWERRQSGSQGGTPVAANRQQVQQRVVLVVLGDHLDRSERLLVELKHGNSGGAPMQAEAQELLAANRLYRVSAAQAGDQTLASALDRLERVLVEVANQPDGLTQQDITRIQTEMNTDGLLFEVRVLRSKVLDQQQNRTVRSKGVPI